MGLLASNTYHHVLGSQKSPAEPFGEIRPEREFRSDGVADFEYVSSPPGQTENGSSFAFGKFYKT